MEGEEPPAGENGQGQPEKSPTGESGAPRGQGQEVKQPKLPNLEVKTPAPGGAKDSDPFEVRDSADFESKHPRAANGEFGKSDIKSKPTSNNNDLKNKEDNGNIYLRLNEVMKSKEILNAGETIEKPEPIKIKSMNPHAGERMAKHEITQEEAQNYINNALVRIRQSSDKYEYIAKDGTSIILEAGRLITAYPLKDYDDAQKEKLEVILNVLQNNK